MKKTKIKFDIKIDLHGFTQQESFEILSEKLAFYYQTGLKRILIITGKSGVLKEAVPKWLELNPIFNYISTIESAPIYLGGEGAILVILKKIPMRNKSF